MVLEEIGGRTGRQKGKEPLGAWPDDEECVDLQMEDNCLQKGAAFRGGFHGNKKTDITFTNM